MNEVHGYRAVQSVPILAVLPLRAFGTRPKPVENQSRNAPVYRGPLPTKGRDNETSKHLILVMRQTSTFDSLTVRTTVRNFDFG